MSILFSGFWDTGAYFSSLFGTEKTSLNNLSKIIIPFCFLILFISVVCIALYILYASLFAEKLDKDENIEKFYNKNPAIRELESEQLSMIRYFENYRIASDGAIICLLLIIALSCIYLVLKIK